MKSHVLSKLKLEKALNGLAQHMFKKTADWNQRKPVIEAKGTVANLGFGTQNRSSNLQKFDGWQTHCLAARIEGIWKH